MDAVSKELKALKVSRVNAIRFDLARYDAHQLPPAYSQKLTDAGYRPAIGAAGSSSMAAARSALPVAGCCGDTKALQLAVSARTVMTDLHCKAVSATYDGICTALRLQRGSCDV